MFGVLQDKVLDRALVELEGDPAHGLVEAHLVEEVELEELALLFGGRGSSPAPDFAGRGLHVEGRRRGRADSHQLADLVVAQGGGRVVILGGATAQDTFDDGIGHGWSWRFGPIGSDLVVIEPLGHRYDPLSCLIGVVSALSSESTTKTASNFAGLLLLALRLIEWIAPGPSDQLSPAL